MYNDILNGNFGKITQQNYLDEACAYRFKKAIQGRKSKKVDLRMKVSKGEFLVLLHWKSDLKAFP